MDLNWIFDASTWVGLLTLIILEIVLGIDNLVFVTIISSKVKPEHRDKTRIIGLSLAIVIRILMLFLMSYMITLTKPLFIIHGFDVSFKDILMIVGGLFLIYKATNEIHEKLEGNIYYTDSSAKDKLYQAFGVAVIQIVILDTIFSIDSIITAVHIVDHISIAMVAVIISMIAMIITSKSLFNFINNRPTIVMLCLGFLLMIALSLILEGFHISIPKTYLYVAIGFAILIEIFNQISFKNQTKKAFSNKSWRHKTTESILGVMGIRENVIKKNNKNVKIEFFADNEKSMIRNVLSLAEKPITAIMQPRKEIEKLDISLKIAEQKSKLIENPHSKLIVVNESGIEEPLGYIEKKDILKQFVESKSFDIKSLIKQPLFLPETTSVLNAMEKFRDNKKDIALIVDEFGAILGLITIKDLMETIAGDFPEDYEKKTDLSIIENKDKSLIVDGSLEYEELANRISLPIITENKDFNTIAGLIFETLQHIPKIGESINYHGYKFIVYSMKKNKINKIKIIPEKKD